MIAIAVAIADIAFLVWLVLTRPFGGPRLKP